MYINNNHYHEDRFTTSDGCFARYVTKRLSTPDRPDRGVTTERSLVVVDFDGSVRTRSNIETDISDHE